jgi:hypothetical protein
MRRLAVLFVVIAGCSSLDHQTLKVGQALETTGPCTIYTERGAFQLAKQLQDSGAKVSFADADGGNYDVMYVLDRGSILRILEVVPGGAKVVVERRVGGLELDKDKSNFGWVLDIDLH